ncbi:MAG: cyclopropane-fatty-acyl-phospholipid synthase family protein [Pseudomonadota bacterium]
MKNESSFEGTSGGSNLLGLERAGNAPGRDVSDFDRWLVRTVFKVAGNPELAIRLWNGEEFTGTGGVRGTVEIRNRKTLWKLITNADLHFGDAYSAGAVEVEGDMVEILEAIYRGTRRTMPPGSTTRRVSEWWNRPRRRNSRRGSLKNIHHHYNLGNPFYELWLDPQMVYTCAYYPHPDATLEQAQTAKLDHVCKKLQLRAGQRVVEAGCGWGALAIHMAQHYGVEVQAYNISHQQVVFARERAQALGVNDRVTFVEDDYRTIADEFDAFVSVGMLEHVGVEHFRGLGNVARRAIKPGGRGLIHSIGRNSPAANNAWIEKRIFPGSRPPSISEMSQIFEPYELSVLDLENLRLHYGRTCAAWLANFERVSDRVREMYDDAFVRAWRLYLAGSVAAFSTGSLQLFQVVFAHLDDNTVPMTREHLYK